jgi:mitogen-activated protein kinase 15
MNISTLTPHPEPSVSLTPLRLFLSLSCFSSLAGEMLNGRPVFPGTSTMNQIERVIQVTNMPSKADIDAVASPFAATMLETLPVMNYKTIPETFPTATPDGLDVLHACFHFNPDKRPSAEELLRHVFVAEFHNEEEEPNFPGGGHSYSYHVLCVLYGEVEI